MRRYLYVVPERNINRQHYVVPPEKLCGCRRLWLSDLWIIPEMREIEINPQHPQIDLILQELYGETMYELL